MPDANLLLLVVMVLQDAGGLLPPGQQFGAELTGSAGTGDGAGVTAASSMAAGSSSSGAGGGGVGVGSSGTPLHLSNAADCIRQYLGDILEFLADIHTLGRLKNVHGGQSGGGSSGGGAVPGLDEDTLGAALKASLGQYVALEMSRSCAKDQKSVARYLPWLYNAPSSLQQQGVKEYAECVAHMRTLAWLVLGTLTQGVLLRLRGGRLGQRGGATAAQHHLAVGQQAAGQAAAAGAGGGGGTAVTQPIPQEASCHIAEHIQVGFGVFAMRYSGCQRTRSGFCPSYPGDHHRLRRAVQAVRVDDVGAVQCVLHVSAVDGVPGAGGAGLAGHVGATQRDDGRAVRVLGEGDARHSAVGHVLEIGVFWTRKIELEYIKDFLVIYQFARHPLILRPSSPTWSTCTS